MLALRYVSWYQNGNTELMTAVLFLSAPRGVYKDNESIGAQVTRLPVDNDGCVCKLDYLNINQ